MSRSLCLMVGAFSVVLTAVGCDEAIILGGEFGRCADFDPLRQPFWGDTHVHTTLSLDANLQATRTTPADAYAFAQGRPIGIQPYNEDGSPTRMAQLDRPLDFVMLSDHAEFLGTIKACSDTGSLAYNDPQCVDYRSALEFDADPRHVFWVFVQLNALTAVAPNEAQYPALCGTGDVVCLEAGMDVWGQVQESAERFYDRTDSCKFTSFVGYEWSAGPATNNLHRNIMFKNENVTPLPYSYFDEPYVEGLWARLQEECIDAGTGCDTLAIPHNSNLSDGVYFEDKMANGEPFNAAYVETRNVMEPIAEVYQHKGASECLPGEMISDELCGFEILPFADLAGTNLESFGEPDPRGFLRHAYGEGMQFEADLGTNPFQLGIISATDTHISAPGFVEEDDFKGHGGAGQPNRYLPPPLGFPDIEYLSPGGLAGVWAEENAREALFAAMRRKETFGTSGPRIVVRMFGGWDYATDLCETDAETLAEEGYAGGVPMGGNLATRPAGSSTPKFIVSARQDAVPLQRIQIVKGWLDGDGYQVEVFEVDDNPDNGASVDLATCEPDPGRGGFSSLCKTWTDPSFDPNARAYYYARVIENPTCRWTTRQCAEAEYDCNDWDYDECQALKLMQLSNYTCDCCDPAVGLNVAMCDAVDCSDPDQLSDLEERCCYQVEPSIQERAWTSPIWYQPPS